MSWRRSSQKVQRDSRRLSISESKEDAADLRSRKSKIRPISQGCDCCND